MTAFFCALPPPSPSPQPSSEEVARVFIAIVGFGDVDRCIALPLPLLLPPPPLLPPILGTPADGKPPALIIVARNLKRDRG